MISAPPPYVAWQVDQVAPGFWSVFVEKANRALRGLDITPTSWWRGGALNEQVGGDPQSQHLIGTAIDISGPHWWAAAEYLSREGFIVVRYPERGYCHAQAWPAGTAHRVGLL